MALCRQFDGFLEREVDGEILLLDTESNLIHQLNRTASLIWRKCQEGASPWEIADVLAKEFEVEEDRARADVERTVAQLEQIGVKRKR
jgi:hypothetical protein